MKSYVLFLMFNQADLTPLRHSFILFIGFKIHFISPPCQTVRQRVMFSRCSLLRLSVWSSVRSSVRFSEILKMGEPTLMQIGTSGQRDKNIKRPTLNIMRSKVKSQGHTRPKIDLKAWRRHHSRPRWIE